MQEKGAERGDGDTAAAIGTVRPGKPDGIERVQQRVPGARTDDSQTVDQNADHLGGRWGVRNELDVEWTESAGPGPAHDSVEIRNQIWQHKYRQREPPQLLQKPNQIRRRGRFWLRKYPLAAQNLLQAQAQGDRVGMVTVKKIFVEVNRRHEQAFEDQEKAHGRQRDHSTGTETTEKIRILQPESVQIELIRVRERETENESDTRRDDEQELELQ